MGGGGEFIRSGRRGSVGSFVNKLVETRPEKMKNCGTAATLEFVFGGKLNENEIVMDADEQVAGKKNSVKIQRIV